MSNFPVTTTIYSQEKMAFSFPWRKSTRWLIRCLLAIPLAILLYALAALLLGMIPVHESPPERAEYEIMLFSTGIHLDICLPAQSQVYDWTTWLPPDHFGLSLHDARYVSFGWGDSSFYVNTPTWHDLDFGVAWRALFTPTPSALHVSYFQQAPEQLQGFVRVPVSEAQLTALTSYLRAPFALEAHRPARFHGSYSPPNPDAFYRATPRYHVFHTCNDWVNRGLKQAGIRAVVWTPVDQLVLRQFQAR